MIRERAGPMKARMRTHSPQQITRLLVAWGDGKQFALWRGSTSREVVLI